MQRRFDDNTGTVAATVTAAAMIAQQVGGKAIRDALFLSNYPVTTLPVAILAAALLSIVSALLAARILTAHGPHRVIPATFAASAALLLGIWMLGEFSVRAQAAVLYLHISVLGMLQISGFWSLVNESYDPRAAKRRIGRIAAGATLGGLVGGILAERIGSFWGLGATLPMLAGLHILCALTSLGLRPLRATPGVKAGSKEDAAARPAALEGATSLGLRVLARTPYLRSLTALVLLSTLAAAFVDYVFKMQAASRMSGPALLRLFAGFYVAVGLVTFLVQTTASRRILARVGLSRTVAALPLGVAAGSLGALMAPGLVTAGIARGLESVLRNSLYRSGYEVLFSPVPAREKRATRTLVDVGVERVGDAFAALTIQLIVSVAVVITIPLLLGLALVCAVTGITITRRLQEGYVATLERSLLTRAEEMDLTGLHSRAASSALTETVASFGWAGDSTTGLAALPRESLSEFVPHGSGDSPSGDTERTGETAPAEPASSDYPQDPLLRRVLELRSGDADRVRRALGEIDPADRALTPHVIPLLAWEAVADAAGKVLHAGTSHIVGQLVDALVDPDEEFAIRRRIPRLLSECTSPLAVEGLLQGLLDRRFEVRFRCGRALIRLQETIGILSLDVDRVYLPVLREVAVDRAVWESQKLIDLSGDDEESPFVDRVLRDRASRSLEHVFTVLSLVLPRQALQVAFRGLHADDPALRGTALEYLESILPPHVRDPLWSLLEERRPGRPTSRSREEVLADLMRSNESIELDLRAAQRRKEVAE